MKQLEANIKAYEEFPKLVNFYLTTCVFIESNVDAIISSIFKMTDGGSEEYEYFNEFILLNMLLTKKMDLLESLLKTKKYKSKVYTNEVEATFKNLNNIIKVRNRLAHSIMAHGEIIKTKKETGIKEEFKIRYVNPKYSKQETHISTQNMFQDNVARIKALGVLQKVLFQILEIHKEKA